VSLLSTLTPSVRWWHRIGVFPALLVGGLASCAATWPKTVERPPPQYEVPVTQIDPAHEVAVPFDRLQQVCSTSLGALKDRWRYWMGCYVPATDLSYIPSDWPDRREVEALRIHENGHRLGWRHGMTNADVARAIKEAWK
jgi:hypothetical protein